MTHLDITKPPQPSLFRSILADKLWQSLIGVIVVLLVTVAYLFNNVLDTPLLGGTKVVDVRMTSTGGLFEGSVVTYRGVKIGKVRTIRLDADGVDATIVITAPDNIPVDSLVRVRSLSPVGEQYLDFEPRTAAGPYLKSGDVVPASSTDLPKTLASTVIAVNKLLQQIDPSQLHTLLTQLATGLAGTGQEIGKLVDQGSVLLADLDRLWPQTDQLITNASGALDIGPQKADDLRTLATSSKEFAAFLKDYNPRFNQLLTAAPGQITQLQGLVSDAQSILPAFLKEAVVFSDLFRAYAPHLGVILATYAEGLGVLPKAIYGGLAHIRGIPQRPTVCDYGTTRRNPDDPTRRPMVTTAHCPSSAPNEQRGAAHAPGPVQ
jgi:phospholipid/cholesterol/gamma-HCH transport system substrate-binding protein